MSAARFGERQALRHDRVDLVRPEQLKQRTEVFPEPILVVDAQLLNALREHSSAG